MTRATPRLVSPPQPSGEVTLSITESSVAARLTQARDLRDTGYLAQAVQTCQEALELEPRHVEANQLFYDLVAEQQGLPPRGEPLQEIEVNHEAFPFEGTGRNQDQELAEIPVLLIPAGIKGARPPRVANDSQTPLSKEPETRQVDLQVENVELAVPDAERARLEPRQGAHARLSVRWMALLAAGLLGLVFLVNRTQMTREEPSAAPGSVGRPAPHRPTLSEPVADPNLVVQLESHSELSQPSLAPSEVVGENDKSEPVAPARLEPASAPSPHTPSLKPSPPSKPTEDGMLEIYNLPPGVSLVLQGPGASSYDLKGSGSRRTWKRMDLPLGHYRLRVVGKASPDCSAKEMRVVIEEGIYTKVDFQSRCRAVRESDHGNR